VSRWPTRLGRVALLAATALACGGPGAAPYGLAHAPVQRFHLEAEETLDVDGTLVEVQRVADLRLEVESAEPGVTRVQLFVDRYYQRVEGAPGGTTELTISERGVATHSPQGRALLDPNARTPGGGRVRELTTRPVEAVALGPAAELLDTPWHTRHALLMSVHLLDWLLLGFGPVSAQGSPAWNGTRRVPQIGQYQLGVELPIRGQLDPAVPERVHLGGSVARASLRIAEDFEGALALDYTCALDLGPAGRPERARLELQMDFRSTAGSRVSSRHRVQIHCLDCDQSFRAAARASDRSHDRARIP
jgi:hypothetical protein